MKEEEKIRIAQEAIMAYYSADDPDNKRYALQVNDSVSEEAKRIHRESIVIDTCSFYLEKYNWHLQESGVTAVNLTVPRATYNMGQTVWSIIDHYEAVRKDQEHFILAETGDDIRTAKRENKVGVILGAQTCKFLEHGDVDSAVEVFAKMGMRVIQIGYNGRTFASDGCMCGTNAGLSPAGKKLVRALENSGVTVDMSHISERSALDVMDMCTKPPIFSHSNPRELFDHPRNITAEEAKKCAAAGGVIGVCSYVPILWSGKHLPCIEDFVDAIAYYADLVGIEHVGIGIDSNSQPGAYERHETRRLMELAHPNRDVYLAGAEAGRGKACAYPEGLHSLANIVNIVEHMLKRGFSESDIKKVLGENFLRVFDQTWRSKEFRLL